MAGKAPSAYRGFARGEHFSPYPAPAPAAVVNLSPYVPFLESAAVAAEAANQTIGQWLDGIRPAISNYLAWHDNQHGPGPGPSGFYSANLNPNIPQVASPAVARSYQNFFPSNSYSYSYITALTITGLSGTGISIKDIIPALRDAADDVTSISLRPVQAAALVEFSTRSAAQSVFSQDSGWLTVAGVRLKLKLGWDPSPAPTAWEPEEPYPSPSSSDDESSAPAPSFKKKCRCGAPAINNGKKKRLAKQRKAAIKENEAHLHYSKCGRKFNPP